MYRQVNPRMDDEPRTGYAAVAAVAQQQEETAAPEAAPDEEAPAVPDLPEVEEDDGDFEEGPIMILEPKDED